MSTPDNRRAIVMPATGDLPGVHGFLNGLLYYGHQDLELHLLTIPGSATWQELEAGTFNFYPWLHVIDINVLRKRFADYPHHPENDTAWITHFYRYLYVADCMSDYDSVLIVDSDMLVLNNLDRYFEWTAATGRTLVPNNDFSGYEFDSYDPAGVSGASSPPICNIPIFCKPEVVASAFRLMPQISMDKWVDDMAAITFALDEVGLLHEIVLLPCLLWLPIHYYLLPLWRRQIAGRYYLATWERGDRMNMLHRRWWDPGTCDQYLERSGDEHINQVKDTNVRWFNWFTRFFNLQCIHTISWHPDWAILGEL